MYILAAIYKSNTVFRYTGIILPWQQKLSLGLTRDTSDSLVSTPIKYMSPQPTSCVRMSSLLPLSTYSKLPASLLLTIHWPPSLHPLLLEEVHQLHLSLLLPLPSLLWQHVQGAGGGTAGWLRHRREVQVKCT